MNGNSWYHDTFKEDLVQLLRAASDLLYLRIQRRPVGNDQNKLFPELLTETHPSALPRLRSLHLTCRSTLFTRRELDLWGFQGGWSRLQHLSLCRATDLIPVRYSYVGVVSGINADHLYLYLVCCASAQVDAPGSDHRPCGWHAGT